MKKLLEHSKKQIKVQKLIREKMINIMLNGKDTKIHLAVVLIKKDQVI